MNFHSSQQETQPARIDPMGFAAWGAAMNVDPSNVLAMTAGILSGLAAPAAVLSFPWGNAEVPRLHLVVPESEGTSPQALEYLLEYPCTVNRLILGAMAAIHPGELLHLFHGSFASKPSKPDANGFIESSNLRRLQSKLGLEEGMPNTGSSREDLDVDFRGARIENIFRPAVLLESPALRDIPELVANCHRSHALAVRLRLESLLTSSRRRREVEELARFLWRTEVILPAQRHPSRIEHHRPAGLQAIFQADTCILRRLLADIKPLVEDSLLLADGEIPEGMEVCGREFIERWEKAAYQVVSLRRDGKAAYGRFVNDAAAHRFQRLNREYLHACNDGGVKAGSSVRNLPLCLVWTLLVMRVGMQPSQFPDEDQIVTSVFAAAHALLQRHRLKLAALGRDASCDAVLRRAEQIVLKITQKEEVTFTQLVRSFDVHRTILYRPIVEALVREEVLMRKANGRLVVGAKPFEEMNRAPLLEIHDGEEG